MVNQERLFSEPSDVVKESSTATGESRDAASDPTIIAQVHELVRAIPEGRVMSYGAVGARCDPPISGYICGRIMHHAVADVPWWRVVAKDGSLPINKRNAHLAQQQRSKLQAEGIELDAEGKIPQSYFV